MPEKYMVPQFIDNEDKILGPITVRQFLIMLGAVAALFIAYKLSPSTLIFVLIALLIIVVAGTFGFVKIQSQPFHLFFLNFLASQLRPSLRVWDKELNEAQLRAFIELGKVTVAEVDPNQGKRRPTSSRLRDLTLVVNTGGVYKPDDDPSF